MQEKSNEVPDDELQAIAAHVTTEQDWADRAKEYLTKFNQRGQQIAALTAENEGLLKVIKSLEDGIVDLELKIKALEKE